MSVDPTRRIMVLNVNHFTMYNQMNVNIGAAAARHDPTLRKTRPNGRTTLRCGPLVPLPAQLHASRPLNGLPLSTRGSTGIWRNRSAMMLR